MSRPRELRAGEQILGSFQRAVAEAHLARLDFASALPLMVTSSAHRALQGLVAYAQQRLDFDFDTAQATLLDEVMRHGDAEIRRFADTLSQDLDALRADGSPGDRLKALLAELFWNSEIAFQQRRYADFLARVFRFQEAVLRYLVETFCIWPTDTGPKAKQATVEAWNRRLTENPALRTHFTEKGVKGGRLSAKSTASPSNCCWIMSLVVAKVEEGNRSCLRPKRRS